MFDQWPLKNPLANSIDPWKFKVFCVGEEITSPNNMMKDSLTLSPFGREPLYLTALHNGAGSRHWGVMFPTPSMKWTFCPFWFNLI
jgi:hypothetical protein